ncbi:NERD domain-containing protein [Cytobacillus sp. FJAT-54145]|uniref:NERD domain-containing protein n=1 Tax=Cytobacillus spartinae TaxID=3299023 RepID=A0ABW6K877_9BACI
MIVKKLELPIRIRKLEALLRRLSSTHHKRELIEADLAKIYAGYKGENSIQYFLDLLPKQEFFIFHDLRIPNENHFFQIDILILSNSFILILEVKNIYGTLYFDQNFNQLIRTANNKEEGFPDPIIQAKRHQLQLENWLKYRAKTNLPIESFVVISNPASILKTDNNNKNIGKKVIHAHVLLDKVEELIRRYANQTLDSKSKQRITKLLLKDHKLETFSVLEKYQICKEEVITGVICPKCNNHKMTRSHGTWYCENCQTKDKLAHIQAIYDYFLLLSSSITNQQARDFLLLASEDTVARLLQQMKLPQTGAKKGRVYYPPTTYL